MGTFNKMYNDASSPEEQEVILKEAVRAIIKKEQKEKWAQILASDYAVQKNKRPNLLRGKVINIYAMMAIAASILLLAVLVPKFYLANQSIEEMSLTYLKDDSIKHPGVTKGAAEINQDLRLQAIVAFDSGQFAMASQKFLEIPDLNTEDQFYLALSYLNSNKYDEAIEAFRNVSSLTESYDQEISWFLGLAFILNDDRLNAKNTLTKVKKGEWKYEEVQILLEKLK